MSKMVRKNLFVIVAFLFFLSSIQATALQGRARKYLDEEVAKAKFVVVAKFVSGKTLPNTKVQESVKARTERLSDTGLLCDFQILKILKQPDGTNIDSPLRMWLLSVYDDCKSPPFYYAQKPPAQDSEWILIMMSNRTDKDGALLDVERASATPEALLHAEQGLNPMNNQKYGNVRISKIPDHRIEMCDDR